MKLKLENLIFVWPFYSIWIIIGLCLYISTNNIFSLLFCLSGFLLHYASVFSISDFSKKLEILTNNMNAAGEENDPIKQAMLLSIAAMRNSNICAMESNKNGEREKEWLFLAEFYENLRKIHRESFHELIKEKQNEGIVDKK